MSKCGGEKCDILGCEKCLARRLKGSGCALAGTKTVTCTRCSEDFQVSFISKGIMCSDCRSEIKEGPRSFRMTPGALLGEELERWKRENPGVPNETPGPLVPNTHWCSDGVWRDEAALKVWMSGGPNEPPGVVVANTHPSIGGILREDGLQSWKSGVPNEPPANGKQMFRAWLSQMIHQDFDAMPPSFDDLPQSVVERMQTRYIDECWDSGGGVVSMSILRSEYVYISAMFPGVPNETPEAQTQENKPDVRETSGGAWDDYVPTLSKDFAAAEQGDPLRILAARDTGIIACEPPWRRQEILWDDSKALAEIRFEKIPLPDLRTLRDKLNEIIYDKERQ